MSVTTYFVYLCLKDNYSEGGKKVKYRLTLKPLKILFESDDLDN